MNYLNYQKTGLAVGLFLGGWHLIWSLLVLIGVGQALINFVLWAHMIHLEYIVGPFDLTAALTLVVITFIFGYFLGLAFAYIWNKLHKSV